jgi:transcriptional regulator with XRE-family HTH domain
MPSPTGRAFNEWLRAQLKAKKMSQRQLAQQSGVDHSTISRLVRGDRMPSLGTATKLARGLRELSDTDDGPQYLGLMNGGGTQNPTARVEYSLRADEALGEAQVRQVMEYYLAVRMRHVNRVSAAGPMAGSSASAGSSTPAGSGASAGSNASAGSGTSAGLGTSAGSSTSAGAPSRPPLPRSEPPTPFVRTAPSYGRPTVAVGGTRTAMTGREASPGLRRDASPALRRVPGRESY